MLKRYNVTVRRFEPSAGPQAASAEEFILPVDSPDEEHAVSAAMSNAVAFTPKVKNGQIVSVAFTCTAVTPRS